MSKTAPVSKRDKAGFESSEAKGLVTPIPWFRGNVGTLQIDFTRPKVGEYAEIASFGVSGPVLFSGPDGIKVFFRSAAGIDIIRFEAATKKLKRSVKIEWRGGIGEDRASVSLDGVEITPVFDARILRLSEDQSSLTWGQSGDLSEVTLKYWPSRS